MHFSKNARRWTAITLATLMVALAGCSNSGSNNNSTGPAESASATNTASTSEGSKSFNLWLGWAATINNDSLIQKYWKETKPGINVELEATQGDAMTALNLKINTGGFTDAALFQHQDTYMSAMMRSNQIMSVEQYFNMPDKYPNLAKIPKVYLDRLKDKDGHIWAIPTWFDQNPDNPWPGWASTGWFVRTDIVEQTGMKLEDLSTMEGMETFLKKAAEQKDKNGKPIIPLSFLMDPNDTANANDENAVLTAFGVSTAGSGVEKVDNQFVFSYDNPNYKAAYQWMNKMYRDKLIDPEVVTSKKELYQEKNNAGRVALNVGSLWNGGAQAKSEADPGWYYQVIPFPKVNGVDKIGTNQVINPYPQWDVYISSKTKNLEAILKFLDYTLDPNPVMQQEVNEGPAGLYWDWTEQPQGKWKFIDEAYKTDRNAGDQASLAKATPQLYMLSSYSTEWYPWWNYGEQQPGDDRPSIFSEAIGKMGGVRTAHSYDLVNQKPGGLWEKYSPELENVRKEYRAKLIMAKDDATFESAWNEFRNALEKRAHWSELKTEWQETYNADIQANGEF